MAIQTEITVRYLKASGMEGIYSGTFYGEDPSDCIRVATEFVIKYLRPANIIAANLTPTPVI